MPRLCTLDSIETVVDCQQPIVIGQPIPMISFTNNLPKSCGNPWIGAYSKHGFWYKFYIGCQSDFDTIVAYSIDTDQWLLQYASFDIWKQVFGDDFNMIVAKNQKLKVLGSIAYCKYSKHYAQIGVYWMMEDYRHSGIGMKLFTYAMEQLAGTTNIIFNSVNYLQEKIKMIMEYNANWRIQHMIIDKPQTYEQLNKTIDSTLQIVKDIDQQRLLSFDYRITGLRRSNWIKYWIRNSVDSHVRFAINTQGSLIGYGMIREMAGGSIKQLLIGPLYAIDQNIAKCLLYHLINIYHVDDVEWNPQLNAIHRRTIHLFVPDDNQTIHHIIDQLGGDVRIDPISYQTCSTRLQSFEHEFVYSISDIHMAQI